MDTVDGGHSGQGHHGTRSGAAIPAGKTARSELEARLRSELVPDLEIVRLLGTGAQADVFLARESALKRLVAVKVLHSRLSNDPVMRRRFEREAQSAARIRHPNVTPVYRVGRLADGVPYIVMEYIDGRTLSDMLAARGPLSIEEARGVLVNVASALAAAHEQGIVHRDVRPGNVFIESRTGRAVLADFGIVALRETGADDATQLTTVGMRLGDVRYMSPEQLSGEQVTDRSDVYALGLLAHEVLTGHVPFDDAVPAMQIRARLHERPRSPAELRPEIPPALAQLVQNCLAPDPNHRPYARELVSLGQASADEAGSARGPALASAGPVGGFLAELKRRHVYKIGAFYLVVGLGLVEAANNLVPPLGLPETTITVIAILVVVGFPVALVLSWIYDFRAGEIQRTERVDRPRRATAIRARVVPWIALALSATLAAALIAWLLRR